MIREQQQENKQKWKKCKASVLCVEVCERKNRVLSKSRECGKNTPGGYHLYNS
jgi:hypothetical protein